MSRELVRSWFSSRPSSGVNLWGVAMLAGVILGAASDPAEAAWGMPYGRPTFAARPSPPDQSWLGDIPERPGVRSKGKVAVFVFKGDDVYQPVRAEVVRLLRRKGLNVTASLQPVDTAAQFREMSYALKLAAYVEGEVVGEGPRQSARIRLRSGVTGQSIASATFSGPTPKIVGEVGRGLWPRMGGAVMHACSSASRPRVREREPMRIEAGSPMENTPFASQSN